MSRARLGGRRPVVAAVAVATMVVGLMSAFVAPAQADTAPPSVPNLTPVAGSHWSPAPVRTAVTPSVAAKPAAVVAPPEAGTYAVTAAASSSTWTPVASTGIDIQTTAPVVTPNAVTPNAASAVAALRVTVLDQATAKSYGLSSGLAVRVARADGGAVGAVQVRAPAAMLNNMYGADYASRVQWKAVPDPAAVAPAGVPQAAIASSVLMAAVSGTTSATGTGSFAATPLKPSDSWQVSAQSGDFSWSVPFATTPAAAGPSPSVSLSYDSQSIDGETGSTNNQPSTVGDGWSLSGGGFVERSYVPCSIANPTTMASSGDECWSTDNATISFAGHSGALVKDTASGTWKLQSDDGSKIEHLIGAAAGCGAAQSDSPTNDDCWRVTTTDGTQYYFGLNVLPGYGTGRLSNSVWTVPVFGFPGGCGGPTSCSEAWRWNLDYVVDPHSNAEALFYAKQTNMYSVSGTTATSYTRGGDLSEIDYGIRTGTTYGTSPASNKVLFTYGDRCTAATTAACAADHTVASWPDTPWDQLCPVPGKTTCNAGLVSPSFWSTTMLASVSTQYWVAASSAFATVNQWTLTHSFPDPGDGTSKSLGLTQIGHTGYTTGAGTAGAAFLADPPIVFTSATLPNRVQAHDGLVVNYKFRLQNILEATGASISINYGVPSWPSATPASAPSLCDKSFAAAYLSATTGASASPTKRDALLASNTNLCYPQQWTPPGGLVGSVSDLFSKYVVTSVVTDPRTASAIDPATGVTNDPTQETDYVYTGKPAWRYDNSPQIPAAQRTWSQYAGFSSVQIRVGAYAVPAAQQVTDYTFFQGMDQDRSATGGKKSAVVPGSVDGVSVVDSLWLAGQTRETKTYDGAGKALTTTDNNPTSTQTANDTTVTPALTAHLPSSSLTASVSPTSTGATRTSTSATAYNASGLPSTVSVTTSDSGLTPASTSTCTSTTYATNAAKNMYAFPDEVSVVGVPCSGLASANYSTQAVSDTQTYYDGAAFGTVGATGNVTQTAVVSSYTGTTKTTAVWLTTATATYDALGRVLTSTDPTDGTARTTTTTYTPTAGGPVTGGSTKNSLGWVTSTVLNAAWGVETSATDQNGHVTTATYDALGRRVQVWLPQLSQASSPAQPSIAYSYVVDPNQPLSVATATTIAGQIVTSYSLFDGLGRPVQTQSPADGDGVVISDTGYDSAGRTVLSTAPYWAETDSSGNVLVASGNLFVPSSPQQIPSKTISTYDSAGRVTASTLQSYGAVKYATTTAYSGVDRVDVIPPAGGTPTTTITNVQGKTGSLTQYLSADLSGTSQKTTYGYDQRGSMTSMVDPAGNKWTWTFDSLGRNISATDPDTGASSTTYDAANRVVKTVDGRGQALSYAYDNLDPANRKTVEYAGPSSASAKVAAWTYDTLSKGQLTSSTSYVGAAAYTEAVTGYDVADKPTGQSVTLPGGTFTAGSAGALAGTYKTTLAYNSSEQLVTQTDQAEGGLAAESLNYDYDAFGNITGLHGADNYLNVALYNPLFQLVQYSSKPVSGGASVFTTLSTDQGTGRLMDIRNTVKSPTGAFSTAADRAYTYDNAGEVTSESTTADGVATDRQCFSYDHLQDLTAAWTSGSGDCSAAPDRDLHLVQPPQPLDSFTVHCPPVSDEQRMNRAVAPPWIRLSQPLHVFDESLLEVTRHRVVTLLTHHPARPPL